MKALRDRETRAMTERTKENFEAQGRGPVAQNLSIRQIKTIEREVRTVMRVLVKRGISKRDGAAEIRPRLSEQLAGLVLMAVIALLIGLSAFLPAAADAATSGPNNPTSAVNNATVGTVAWTSPANVYTSDNLYATVALGNNMASNYLIASGFNFAIPAGSTINGIAVAVERKEGTAPLVIKDNSVKLVKAGTITGTEHAVTTGWGSTETIATYGSGTDLWGSAWTAADINDPNFGFAISAKGSGVSGGEGAYIDNVTITVYYTTSGVCAAHNPVTVTLSPAARTITAVGGSAQYTVTITNHDDISCAAETFTLAATDNNLAVFNASTLSAPSVTLAAGASDSSVTLTANAQAILTGGTNNTFVTATNAAHTPAGQVSNTVTTTYNPVTCTRSQPTVTLSPASRTIATDGGTASYDVTITNNDTAGCASETFTPSSVFDDNSTNFNASSACLTPVTLLPGAVSNTLTNCVTVKAKIGTSTGVDNSHVNVTSPNHASTSSNNVATTINACVRFLPTISLSPLTGSISTEAGSAPYTFSITNNDSVYCASETFNLTAIDNNLIDFDASQLSSSSVVLAPSQSSSTVTLTVKGKIGHSSGTNTSHVNTIRQGDAHGFISNDVTTTLSAVICTRNAPTMTLAPPAQTISSGGGASGPYTLTITNNDTGPCADEIFNLTESDSDTTTNFSASTLNKITVTVARGASDSTVTLTAHAVAGKTSGTNTSSITAASANHASKTSNNVTTTLNVKPCTRNVPILIITPTSQGITAGDTVTYTVKVKNTDTASCGDTTTFTLSVPPADTNSADFTTPSTLNTGTLNIIAGQSATAVLSVTSKLTAANGVFNDTTVGVTALPLHTAPANVTVRTTVGPVSPLMHNSTNLTSTKWGANGWGIPGGKYGQFECITCHTTETTNIKSVKETITSPNGTDTFPGGPVVFQSPNDFGNDTGGHTTSNKVCEVCHSQTNYHRYDTTGQTVFNHNNNTDCVSCHKHSVAFKASCKACHGNPPTLDTLGGPDGLANTPFPTGSVTAGAHSRHVTDLGFSCDNCHSNSSGHMPEASTVKPGFGDISIGFSNFGSIAGTYSGQAGLSYNNALGTGGLTCSAVYCHGATMAGNNGTNTTPKWNDPTTAACGTCHGATAANPPTFGLHIKHAGSYGAYFGKAYTCTLCHNLAPNQHVDGKSEIAFGPDVRVAGASYSGTDTMLDAYGNCSNVYCHSNVQTSPPGGAVTYKTVNWGDSQSYSCNVCHEGPANHTSVPVSGNTTGSHSKHGTYSMNCGTCHASDATQDPADMAGGRCNVCHAFDIHADHVINVNIVNKFGGTYSGDTTPGTPYGGCSGVYCHSQGTAGSSPYPAPNTAPVWGSTLNAECTGCHNGDSSATGGLTMATNKHGNHVNNAAVIGNNFTCDVCHSATVAAGQTRTIGNMGNHVNKQVNVAFTSLNTGASYSGSVTPGDPVGNCNNLYCHSIGNTSVPVGQLPAGANTIYTNPAWNGAAIGCNGCHGRTTTTGAPDYANGGILPAVANSHPKHTVAGSGTCVNCHSATTTTGTSIIAGSLHINGARDAVQGNGKTFTYTQATQTCSNISCHFNGTAQWGSTLACSACHSSLSAAHAKHTTITGASYGDTSVSTTGGVYIFGCGNCHPSKDPGKHADGNIDIVLNDGAAGDTLKVLNSPSANKTGSGSTTVCNLIYCHSDGTKTGAAIVAGASPQWGNSPYSGDSCAMCHGNSPSSGSHQNHVMAGIHFDTIYTGTTGLAAMGNTATGAHGNAATSNTISCNVCHNGTVTTDANDKNASCSTAGCHDAAPRLKGNVAIAAGSNLHLNGVINVVLQTGVVLSKAQVRNDNSGNAPAGLTRNVGYKVSGAYDSATINAGDWNSGSKTCTTACHLSQQSPTWGTATTCLSCHTTVPR